MNASKIFLYFCLAFIGGIFIGSFLGLPQSLWLGFLIAGALLILFIKKKIIVFGFCLIVLSCGLFRYQTAIDKTAYAEIKYDQQISFQGVIIGEPEKLINKARFQLTAKNIPGRILITTNLYPEYSYGDTLEINGTLKEPAQFEDFDYREYLTKDKIYSVMYYPDIDVIPSEQSEVLGMTVMQSIFSFKDKLRGNINQVLLPPQGSILKAIFLGDKQSISESLKEKFNTTGTRHIVAISGMHMIIMSEILLFLLLGIGLWRRQAFYFVLILLFAYIIMIGAPASAIRAGLMAGLLMVAQQVGRLRDASRGLVFAAVAMLMINPLLLKIDVGFQLSFIASLSIIYLKPIFDKKLENLPEFLNLKDILTLTLAAQIGVLPILIFHFGQVSLISPIANLLIVPFLPFLTLAGLIISISGFISSSLSRLIAWPIYLLLNYIIKSVELLSDVPLAFFEIKYFHWVFLVAYYIVLILIIKKHRLSSS